MYLSSSQVLPRQPNSHVEEREGIPFMRCSCIEHCKPKVTEGVEIVMEGGVFKILLFYIS